MYRTIHYLRGRPCPSRALSIVARLVEIEAIGAVANEDVDVQEDEAGMRAVTNALDTIRRINRHTRHKLCLTRRNIRLHGTYHLSPPR